MSSTSTRLQLPLIEAAQALKHITHNEAIERLDLYTHLAFTEMDVTAPPGSPTVGECLAIGSSATGDFAGQDGQIACYTVGGWRFVPPVEGQLAYDLSAASIIVYRASAWGAFSDALAFLGINTSADTTNRLAVRSETALFTNIDSGSSGSGDVRLVLNKEGAVNNASFVFQTSYTGHAEFGLTGSNNFSIKSSPDGSAWATGLTLNSATNIFDFAQPPAVAGLPVALLAQLDGSHNKIINGDFTVNQRGGTKTPGVGTYGYDRWKGHADGLEQIIEALEAGDYTLSWDGGGTGTFGGTTASSPFVATASAGDISVIVPSTATRVALVLGDLSAYGNSFGPRHIAHELGLCRRYGQVKQASGLAADLAHEMRATPSQSGAGPYFYDAEL